MLLKIIIFGFCLKTSLLKQQHVLRTEVVELGNNNKKINLIRTHD